MQAFFGHVHQNVDVIELHNNNIIILPPDFINYFLSIILVILFLDLDISS